MYLLTQLYWDLYFLSFSQLLVTTTPAHLICLAIFWSLMDTRAPVRVESWSKILLWLLRFVRILNIIFSSWASHQWTFIKKLLEQIVIRFESIRDPWNCVSEIRIYHWFLFVWIVCGPSITNRKRSLLWIYVFPCQYCKTQELCQQLFTVDFDILENKKSFALFASITRAFHFLV